MSASATGCRGGWIGRRLTLMTITASCLSLLVAGTVVMALEVVYSRKAMRDDLATLAEIVGSNSAAALVFQDADAATQVLGTLVSRDDVTRAWILERAGRRLAYWERGGAAAPASIPEARPEGRFQGGRLRVIRDVRLGGERVGSVLLESDLTPLYSRLRSVALALAVGVLVSLLAAWALARRLRRPIQEPIARLVERTHAVAEQDYRARLAVQAPGELGVLAAAIDEMAARIERRERMLEEHRTRLEQAVDARTRELRSMSEEARAARDRAEAASRSKSAFVANMSHEIRTPINGIIGMTELVLDSELREGQRTYLEMALASAQSLLSVINDILDFSKIEAHRLELESTTLHLRETVCGALRTVALRAAEKGLELAYRVEPRVPETLVGDPNRLTQILVNLVGNAVKFTERGSVTVGVGLESADAETAVLRFAVTDTGLGMNEATRTAIFQPFSQGDTSATRRFGGTGLGLAICRRLTEMMGGRIRAESAPGRGSTFFFTVRLGRAASECPLEAPELRSALAGRRVVVAVPDPTTRHMVRDLLTAWGVAADAFPEGESAARALGSAPRAVLVASERLLDDPGDPLHRALVALSAQGRPAAVRLAVPSADVAEAGRDGVAFHSVLAVLPVSPSALRTALCRAIGLRTAAEAAPGREARSRRRLSILLAEDNPVNRLVAVRRLESWGHAVTAVSTGREAVETSGRERFDLVLMDVQMPEMDGIAATGAIREREGREGGHLPIVAMTAHALTGDRERILAAGMDDYVAKPLAAEVFFEVVERVAAELAEPAAEAGLLEAAGDDSELFAEMAKLFLEEQAGLLARVREAAAAGREQPLREALHTLLGCVSNFGSRRADEAIVRLQELVRGGALERAGDPSQIAEALRDVENAIGELVEALGRFAEVERA